MYVLFLLVLLERGGGGGGAGRRLLGGGDDLGLYVKHRLGTPVIHFFPFDFGVSVLKLNIRKRVP